MSYRVYKGTHAFNGLSFSACMGACTCMLYIHTYIYMYIHVIPCIHRHTYLQGLELVRDSHADIISGIFGRYRHARHVSVLCCNLFV